MDDGPCTFQVIKNLIDKYIFTHSFTFLHLITDYSKGFGGKYGVQKDHVDKSAVGWDYQEQVEKHESQKGKQYIVILTSTQNFDNYCIG